MRVAKPASVGQIHQLWFKQRSRSGCAASFVGSKAVLVSPNVSGALRPLRILELGPSRQDLFVNRPDCYAASRLIETQDPVTHESEPPWQVD